MESEVLTDSLGFINPQKIKKEEKVQCRKRLKEQNNLITGNKTQLKEDGVHKVNGNIHYA